MDFTEKVEQFEAKRIEAMTELGGLRQISLTQLMNDLGIKSPTYVWRVSTSLLPTLRLLRLLSMKLNGKLWQ